MTHTALHSLLIGHVFLWGLLLASPGCCVFPKVTRFEPDLPKPASSCQFLNRCQVERAEEIYAAAVEAEQLCDDRCVDLFLQTAVATRSADGPADEECRLRTLHKAALAKLIETGQTFCRLDPSTGLTIGHGLQQQVIPLHKQGFVWSEASFHQLHPIGDYQTKSVTCIHRCPGQGIPLVVTNSGCDREPFLPDEAVFAATLRLQVHSAQVDASHKLTADQIRLELYDPLRIGRSPSPHCPAELVRDTTAPLAYRLTNDSVDILGQFVNPNQDLGNGRLRVLEPYQPGKIPVVLIHGLLSSPYTWVEAINEMRVRPGFLDRYQIWVFDYPTGESFLNSAAALREQLEEARRTFDPAMQDDSLSRMVLVGHSMGGLVAKLQITDSGDQLWRSVANRSFDSVCFPPGAASAILRSFFFRASPDVERVIFIGTPHRGSLYARRLVGRLGSALAGRPSQAKELHRQMVCENPGVFSEEVRQRIPTSIDLLEPNSPLLQAISALPIKPDVHMHAIIGDIKQPLCFEPSDGVVSVSSARRGGEESVRYVTAKHGELNKQPESLQEIFYLLDRHACQSAPIPVSEGSHHDSLAQRPTPTSKQ